MDGDDTNIYVGWIPTSTRFLAFELMAEHIIKPKSFNFSFENYFSTNKIIHCDRPKHSTGNGKYFVLAQRYTYETLGQALNIKSYKAPHIYVLIGNTFKTYTNSSLTTCSQEITAFRGRLIWHMPDSKEHAYRICKCILSMHMYNMLNRKSELNQIRNVDYIDFIIFPDGKIILSAEGKNFGSATNALMVEAYQFVKDCFHKHYHHNEKSPLLKYIHKLSAKNNWSISVLSELYNNTINLRRKKKIHNLNDSVGVLTYLISFISLFKQTELKKFLNPKDDEIESANNGLIESINSRIDMAKHVHSNSLILINFLAGTVLSFIGLILGYAQIDNGIARLLKDNTNSIAVFVYLLLAGFIYLYWFCTDLDLPFPIDYMTIFNRLTRGWSISRKRTVLIFTTTLLITALIIFTAYYMNINIRDIIHL